jgi:4-hydroxy-4-methyl-2-oxoglutarate aldolase
MRTDDDPASILDGLTTAHVADGCTRVGLPVRAAALRPVLPGTRLAGRVLPARHSGSVDVFLAAFERARPGDVLVVDNGGRLDEACVGDLVALEAAGAGLAGIVIWGLHRDTAELRAIGLPVFSLGALPAGPATAEPYAATALERARLGDQEATADDVVVADDDGVLLVPVDRAAEVAAAAGSIRDVERRQAERMAAGESLRAQTRFPEYLAARAASGRTFREHLRAIGGAIEE